MEEKKRGRPKTTGRIRTETLSMKLKKYEKQKFTTAAVNNKKTHADYLIYLMELEKLLKIKGVII